MERFRNSEPLPSHLRGGFAAIGNFDGFHLGHQAVVRQAVKRARTAGKPALVVTFDPHPVRLFKSGQPPFALTTLDQKLELLEAAGVDAACVIRFDRAFAALGAEAFVSHWLAGRMAPSGVVTGRDFTFGLGRSGNTAMLARLGSEQGFVAETVEAIEVEGSVVSSTRIRTLLRHGDTQSAAALLSRPFTIQGVVEHGDALGRTAGSRTLSVALGDFLRAADGVYAVRARLDDGRMADGIGNLRIRQLSDAKEDLLEISLLALEGGLCGRTLEVELHHFLRREGLPAEDARASRSPSALTHDS